MKKAKEYGFSDRQISRLANMKDDKAVRKLRVSMGIEARYNLVDTCAGEFEAYTPYYYSTYERSEEAKK